MLPTTIKDNIKFGEKNKLRAGRWLAGQLETGRARKGSPFCLAGRAGLARLWWAKSGSGQSVLTTLILR